MMVDDPARQIRIAVADDHPALRDGIGALIAEQDDMLLVGQAENGREAIALYASLRPDVMLMDLQMPVVSGLEAISRIRQDAPAARIVVLTTFAGDVQAVRALKAGASAFLLKSGLRKDMVDVIRAVHAGGRHVTPEVAQTIALHAADDPLSDREVAILELVAAGNSNKEVAWRLSISEDTVRAHMRSIFSKLNVDDRTHAVTAALRRGLIEL